MNFKFHSTRLAPLAFAAFALSPVLTGPAAAGSSLKCTHYTITTCTVDGTGKRTCTETGGYDVCVVVSDSKAASATLAPPAGTLPGKTQIAQSKSFLSKR